MNNSDIKWRRQPDTGTIVITQPDNSDEGVYQCFARNDWGTAVSIKASLKKAGKLCYTVHSLLIESMISDYYIISD